MKRWWFRKRWHYRWYQKDYTWARGEGATRYEAFRWGRHVVKCEKRR